MKMLKILSLTENLSDLPRVQKLGSGQWLWLFHIPGQAKSWLRPKVRPSFWPEAKAGTSLVGTESA